MRPSRQFTSRIDSHTARLRLVFHSQSSLKHDQGDVDGNKCQLDYS